MSRSRTASPSRTGARVDSASRAQQPTWKPPTGTRRPVVVALVVLVIVAGAVFFAFRAADESGSVAGAELEHVHGLGVDPGNGMLYAGTHHGLFRLPEDGESVLVADRVQDFMGFTVVGAGHFFASGHPGQGQAGPASLGLIESRDGGRTWQLLSLAGEADFHALEARHGRVYGLNAMTGAFMVSRDLRSWETRARLPMVDFAISPEDPDVVLATTQAGLARSDDGGRSFSIRERTPGLLLVSWAEDGVVVGSDPEGRLYVSTDGGTSWGRRGELGGPPEALTAVDGRHIYAAVGGGVVVSSGDGGRSFDTRYSG